MNPEPSSIAPTDEESSLDSYKLIATYLETRSTVFKELSGLRKRGWANPKGDEHFSKQREKADNATMKDQKILFDMMKLIGREMQEQTGCIKVENPCPQILDLCMAPGGYTSSALHFNPSAQVLGLTLPGKLGGHMVMVPSAPKDPRVKVRFLDVTLLAKDFDVADWNPDHPDAEGLSLITSRIYKDLDVSFDLIFSDGQVLRTHPRASYRERREASRLILSQLVVAMRRVRRGGTFIMLLHKVEAWTSIQLLHCFSQFSKVRVFKPAKAHKTRNSFYMIAQDIRAEHKDLQKAIEGWKESWRSLTFDLSGSSGPPEPLAEDVQELLAEYGATLVELGEPVWQIQLAALRGSTWMQD